MNNIERQRQLEMTSVTRGVERYMKGAEKNREKGREFDTTVGQKVISRMITRMYPGVIQLQKDARKKLVEAQTTGRRLAGWEMAVAASEPLRLAYITCRSVLTHENPSGICPKHHLARRIGWIANDELRWQELREAESARAKRDRNDPPNRLSALKRTVRQINPRSVRAWIKRLDDLPTTKWSAETHIKVGLVLLGVLLETCPNVVESREFFDNNNGRVRRIVSINVKSEVRSAMDKDHQRAAEDAPWLLPMVCPPVEWEWDGKKFAGGYLSLQLELIKPKAHGHTAEVLSEDTVSQPCLTAINVVGATRWRINRTVTEVAAEAERRGLEEVLPVSPLKSLPDDVTADAWAKMSKEDRGRIKRARRQIHDHNNRLEAKREAMRRTLRVAEEFAGEDAIYFPHVLDFRGRAYPVPQDLHPQGDDFAKGLLMFARAVPLGPSGLRWLTYHAAATYGEDKISRGDQVEWAVTHLGDLSAVARDPLGQGYAFWSKAEEPWQFLAAAIELEQAFAHPEGPEAYASSLPVFVDGSCNGLQHLSAMGRDPVGAHATNLTDDPVRQDIYQIVAGKVAGWVANHATDPCVVDGEVAKHWLGRVDRKVVKRGVMTVPYGLTDIGMRDQLIEDRWTEDLEGDPMKNATYLRDLMKEAISDTVVKATEIMGWMQDNAHILASNGRPVDWTAPSGFRVRQAYYNRTQKVIRTVLGETYIWQEGADQTLNVRKQVLSIAPNIIHSFDAAHMMLTIAAARAEGMEDFAVVHDSFGCHAAHMDGFLQIVREEFVNIYKQDWFTSLQAEFRAAVGPDVPLIPPPEQGDFAVEQVLTAQFFFA